MSLDEKKENTEWCKRAFLSKIGNKYENESHNGMTCIHVKKLNKIYKCKLLHDILNTYERNKMWIAITVLSYINVLIHERVEQSLRTFESY